MGVKILLAQPIEEEGVDVLKQNAEVILAPESSFEILEGLIAKADGIIIRTASLPGTLIKKGKRLVVIGRAGTGVEKIDVQAATDLGIAVVNTPDANVVSVAEHVIAFILVLSKRMFASHEALRNGDFGVRNRLLLNDLDGKTAGIIGLGRIGNEVAKKCRLAFNMKVLAYDPYVNKETVKDTGIVLSDRLDDLLRESDFVTLHIPQLPETINFIGKKELKQMKPPAFLINAARAKVVNHKELLFALKEKWIAGAALDVFEEEPPDVNDPLFKLPNVVVTAHQAGLTHEAMTRVSVEIAKEVLKVLCDERPLYLVNPEVWKNRRKIAD